MIVAIEGCIASGKSTTAKLIGERLGWSLVLEETNSHPFLQDFYADPGRYALETELAFALLHYHQLHPLDPQAGLVSDFSPGKDLIFARMNLSGDDLELFEHLYVRLFSRLQKPTLTIFLDLPVEELVRRMRERGRTYEMGIPTEYIQRLREFYKLGMNELGEDVRIVEVAPGESREHLADKVLAIIKASVKVKS